MVTYTVVKTGIDEDASDNDIMTRMLLSLLRKETVR